MFAPRIVDLAQQLALKKLTPDDISVYDRPLVQECFVFLWLSKSPLRAALTFRTL